MLPIRGQQHKETERNSPYVPKVVLAKSEFFGSDFVYWCIMEFESIGLDCGLPALIL